MSGQTTSGVAVPALQGNELVNLVSGGRGKATTQEIANLSSGGSGSVTTLSVQTANGLSGSVANPTTTPAITISTTISGVLKGSAGALVAATAGTDFLTPTGNASATSVVPTGSSTSLTLAALAANTGQTIAPINYGTITDGGHFGDGQSHPASANGFSTLAALQTQFLAASFTATGSSTNLTVSAVTGVIYPGLTLGITTGIGAGITIVGQTSGTQGGAGVYVTSSATTISAAAAIASIARATSDDMAGLMIQAAITAAHLVGGVVRLQAGSYRTTPMGIVMPPNTSATLVGLGESSSVILLCQAASAGNALSIYTMNDCYCPVTNLTLEGFNTGRNYGSTTNGGTAFTSMYVSGSTGLYISQCANVRFDTINIFNFDNAYGWDLVNGNNYSLTFRTSSIQENNKGMTIAAAAPNSNEAMRWEHCSISNNNYGIYIIAQTSTTPGAGSALGGDVYIDQCQIDYNIVNSVYYLGFGSGSISPSTVVLNMCHVETNTACSGTGVWCATDGIFMMIACYCYWATGGSLPLGVVGTLGFWSTFLGTDNTLPGGFALPIPLFYVTSTGSNALYLDGNTNELPRTAIVAATENGNIYGTKNLVDHSNYVTSNYTFDGSETNNPNGFIIAASVNFTVANDSSFDYIIGTQLRLTAVATFTGTIVAAGGVTVTTSGIGLTFGGAKPATVFLTKTAANTWMATGQMT